MEMAKEGFNILIVDKNEHDTNETRKKIEGFGVKCSGFIYDFGNLGTPSAAYEFLAALNTGLWWINQGQLQEWTEHCLTAFLKI